MIFRSLDSNGDWNWGNHKQSYATGNQAIMLNIQTMLKTFYSECFFNTDWGMPWFQLLGQKNTAPLLFALRSQIASCYGVINVTDVGYTLDQDRNFLVNFQVDTIFSTGNQGTITV